MYATQNHIPSCLKGYTIKTTAKSKFSSPNYTFHASVTCTYMDQFQKAKKYKKKEKCIVIFFF